MAFLKAVDVKAVEQSVIEKVNGASNWISPAIVVPKTAL